MKETQQFDEVKALKVKAWFLKECLKASEQELEQVKKKLARADETLQWIAAQAQPFEFKDSMLVAKLSDAMAEFARIALLDIQDEEEA